MKRAKCRYCPNCKSIILKRLRICPECKYRVFGPSISDPERAKKISEMLDSGDYTLQMVGDIFKKTRERIRQIYRKQTGYAYGNKFRQKRKLTAQQTKMIEMEKIAFVCEACHKKVIKKDAKHLRKFCRSCRDIQQMTFRDPTTTAICLNCGNTFHPARNWKNMKNSCLFDSFRCFQEFLRKNNIWTNNFVKFLKDNNLRRIVISGRGI